jgi:hypothetical protein
MATFRARKATENSLLTIIGGRHAAAILSPDQRDVMRV